MTTCAHYSLVSRQQSFSLAGKALLDPSAIGTPPRAALPNLSADM